MFRKFSPSYRPSYRSTLLCSNVVKFVRREIGETVRYIPGKKQNKNSIASQTVATAWIAPEICLGQPTTTYPECSRFHPNRFNFGGVIAERVNTAKLFRRVNPTFGGSLSSSQIIITIIHYPCIVRYIYARWTFDSLLQAMICCDTIR